MFSSYNCLKVERLTSEALVGVPIATSGKNLIFATVLAHTNFPGFFLPRKVPYTVGQELTSVGLYLPHHSPPPHQPLIILCKAEHFPLAYTIRD